jgi:hypothetical protein
VKRAMIIRAAIDIALLLGLMGAAAWAFVMLVT